MDVVAVVDAAEALGLPSSVMDVIAERFIDAPCVSWSDARAAGIRGRDIVQLRWHLAGEVCPRWAQFGNYVTVDAASVVLILQSRHHLEHDRRRVCVMS